MLTAYKRHRKDCQHRDEGWGYNRCKCPFWVYGVVGGVEIRKSLRVSTKDEAESELDKLKASLKKPEEK